MNILLLNHYAGSPELGMEFRPFYLAQEWIRMGHKVTVVAGDYSHLRRINPTVNRDFEEQKVDNINYCYVKTGSYSGNGAARAFSMFRFVLKLMADSRLLVKRYDPDIVIASSTYPLETYAAQRIAKVACAKYVHEVHDMWPSTLYEVGGMSKNHPFVWLMQLAENSAYRHCNKCVSLLPYAKEYMEKHGLAQGKFVYVPNGIAFEEWKHPQPLPAEHQTVMEGLSGKFIVGYFGGHALSNALDTLLEAARITLDDEVHFVLVGDGVEKPKLMNRAESEHICNVTFLPPVPKQAIPSLVKHFDCSYMGGLDSPLYRFGLCLNKMYDSMAAGIPIICAFNAPPTPVKEYGCGVQVPPAPQEIANAILELRSMPKTRLVEMGERGREAAMNRFSYKSLAIKFIDSVTE